MDKEVLKKKKEEEKEEKKRKIKEKKIKKRKRNRERERKRGKKYKYWPVAHLLYVVPMVPMSTIGTDGGYRTPPPPPPIFQGLMSLYGQKNKSY